MHSCMLKVSITGVSKYILGADLGDGKTFVPGLVSLFEMPTTISQSSQKYDFLMIILQCIFQSRTNGEIWLTMNRLCAAMICLFSQLLVENIFFIL